MKQVIRLRYIILFIIFFTGGTVASAQMVNMAQVPFENDLAYANYPNCTVSCYGTTTGA